MTPDPSSHPAPLWHAQSTAQVADALGTDAERGLSVAEAAARLRTHGPNRLAEAPRRPAWMRWVQQFTNPLVYVLVIAGVIIGLLGDTVDASVIAGVVLINALIGYVQEGKAEQALEAVRSLLAARALVIREGARHPIDAGELVPGDVVWIESGDKVPADVRLLRVHRLRITEAALTGESVPVDKDVAPNPAEASIGDRTAMAYTGTLVASGQALGVVVATGAHTEIGRIGALVSDVTTLATPLTRRLDGFARQITWAIVGVSGLTLAWGHWVAGLAWFDLFLAVVGLAVAAIPEGLPAVVTIVLAIGTRIMARQHAIIRRLPAVESLGSVGVICTDKTGTLTRNEMTAVRVVLPEGELRVSGSGYAPEGRFERQGTETHPTDVPTLAPLLHAAALCNDARLHAQPDGTWQMVGDPTEGALATLAHKGGWPAADLATHWPRRDTLPFESERQFMATLHEGPQGGYVVYLKGAPEQVLARCRSAMGGAPFDAAAWLQRVQQAASAGERVLALARKTVGHPELDAPALASDFELLGLIGIIDPPRPEAVAAVAQCQAAGIRVIMITGDHAVTAAAIGAQLGLRAERALSGRELEDWDDATLRQQVADCDVYARATPEHKLRLIAALQAQGHLVAMTGDGVNDAPALKAADIGVAMGGKGTDAAREAADVVLTDDHFATIAHAVREGRVVFDNIRKALAYMLPTNGAQAGVILLALLAGLPLPITAGQILWVNTVTAITLALALAFEPAEPGVMQRPPRPPGEALITRAMIGRILFAAGLMVAATFGVFHWELSRGSEVAVARTAAVNTLLVCEVFYLFNLRQGEHHAWRWATLTGNPVALLMVALLAGLQAVFTYVPAVQAVFQSAPLVASSWGVALGLGGVLFGVIEVEKAVWRRRQTQQS